MNEAGFVCVRGLRHNGWISHQSDFELGGSP